MPKSDMGNASGMNCAKCNEKRSGVESTNIEGKVADSKAESDANNIANSYKILYLGEYISDISVFNADDIEGG
ncbi:15707_t:CDS:1, partial [Dentiscutata erythropus]